MKRNIIKGVFAAVLMCCGIVAFAQNGRNAYDFLNIATSSHVTALGGRNVALIDDDVELVNQNPALLGPEVEKQVQLSYMRWFWQSNFASLRYGSAAGERSAWSVGMRYLDFGSIDGYDENGVATGSFKPSDLVFGGSYSHDFNDRLRGGISLNMIYSHYEKYSAFALSVDAGINWYNPEHDCSFSVVLKNMGGQIKRFDKAYTRLPFDIQIGWMQQLGSSPFRLGITASRLTSWNLKSYVHNENEPDKDGNLKSDFIGNFFKHLTFGLQYDAGENFYIAAGYDYFTRAAMGSYHRNFFSGISLGAGLRVKNWGIGVAYCQPHKGGSTLQLNILTNLQELF